MGHLVGGDGTTLLSVEPEHHCGRCPAGPVYIHCIHTHTHTHKIIVKGIHVVLGIIQCRNQHTCKYIPFL